MIVVTGAAGFIGSCLSQELYRQGFKDLVLVDAFGNLEKEENLKGLEKCRRIERSELATWLDSNHLEVQMILHIGARTDTTEPSKEIFDQLNLHYTQMLWHKSISYGFPIIYASSAATYGGGEHGYQDSHDIIPSLKPLNPYGESKNEFDKWAIKQDEQPRFWIGLKFFNVYGPNEYHKKRMASVIFHAYHQVKKSGGMKLFRSHREEYGDGEQKRDFIYVKNLIEVICFFMENRKPELSGIYNLGTGKAQTFMDLANGLFHALGLETNVSFIDTPLDIRDTYQYFTEADMSKLRAAGFQGEFMDLSQGIDDYVKNYLLKAEHY